MPSKKQFGLKRRREATATPSPRKKPRFSPRKVREERLKSPKKDTRSSSNPEVVKVKDRAAPVQRPTNVERERRDHSVSEKESAPLKDALAMEEPQVNGNCAAPCENMVDPSPAIAPPSLPALECPTLFSCRMYKRLYGRDRENADPALAGSPAGSTKSFQPAVVGEPPKPPTLPESKPPPSHISGPSSHHPPSCLSSRVTSEDLRIYLGVEDPFKSDTSSSSSSKQLELKPVAVSYVKPQNLNVGTSAKVNRSDLKREPQNLAELPPKKLEAPIRQPSAVEPASSPSMPPEKTQDNSSKVSVEQSQSKSPGCIAKAGLLAVGKTRKQTVAAIRPIQTLAAKENSTMVEKLDKNNPIAHEPGGSSIDNSPKSKIADINSTCAEKSSRRLKMPGLPGSAKGRTVRQVFAPISNQRYYSLPTAGNQHDCDKKGYNELCVVNTVSVTSELTVRVEDSKLGELKRQSSAEALFGSPVKWADDSLDSPVTEGSTNSRKLYSIFGSPLKNVDSNSSEHPFSVPPGAYEDSCWTNQIPEKMPTKSSVGEAILQKQSQRSQESVLLAETKPKEKSGELNDAGKVSTTSSIRPLPSSVIKKHVSIFSPVKDSKLSATTNVPDEPSRSNTGICFPFPRPKYEDSVLGQFDDTAQFVSALAKVDSKISPLNTPIKSGDGSNHTQSAIVEENPISFQKVFKKNIPEEAQQNYEPSNLGNSTAGIIASENPNLSVLIKGSVSEEHPAGKPNKSVLSKHPSNENRKTEDGNMAIGSTENPEQQSMFEPPKITITPPKTESSLRLIHRPNFASSTILSVKSWFPNAPVKMVTPRKTPRLVSSVSRCASPKGFEVSAGARIAINDAFIIEQEERVRRWELDHLYENTIRSGSGSPMKSVNGSPTRKRIESPGKISPSKRPPRKHVSPCKSPKRAELHRNVGVENLLQRASDADAPVPRNASNKEKTVNQLVPDSENQTDLVAYSVGAISGRITTEPVKSLPNTTQKLLTMLDAVMTKTKYSEPGFESSLAEAKVASRSVDLASDGAKSQVEDKDTVADHAKSSDHLGPVPPRSTLEQEIVPSQITSCDHNEPYSNAVEEEVCLQNATKEQAVLANPPDSAVLSQIPPPYMPLLFNDKSDPLPVPATGSSNVTNAKASQITLSGSAMPSTKVKANKNKKQGKATQNANNSITSEPVVASKRDDCSDCHINKPPSDLAKSSGGPIGKKVRRSKYAAVISRVKPSAPLNKAVAALITSSTNSASPLQTITTPIAPSTKKSSFKRSSALKPNSQKGAGNSLMNSIRSTFFQGTPTSAKVHTFNSGAYIQTPKLRPICRKSTPDLGVNSANEVMNVQSPTHDSVVTRSQKNVVHSAAEAAVQISVTCSRETAKAAVQDGVALSKAAIAANAGHDVLRKLDESAAQDSITPSKESAEPVEMGCSFPGQWKLLEVDHPTKPISLLRRFLESRENYTLHNPLDSRHKETTNAQTDSLNVEVEKDTISSAANPTAAQKGSKSEPDPTPIPSPVLNGAVGRGCQEKPETHLMPKSDGVEVLDRDSTKLPPKSPNFPRSSFRKTILLDSPMKIVTPSKGKKRSGESVKSPKPKEKCGESLKSLKSKEKFVGPETVERSRTRTASGGRGTSEKKPKKAFAEPERPKVELPRKSRYTESRHSRDWRSVSRAVSPRKSPRTKRDESPKRRQRKKPRTTHHESPERSARRSEVIKPDDKSQKRASKSEEGKSKIISSKPASRKSEISESSDRKSEITALESADGKSRINSPESSDRKFKTASSQSVGKQSKNSSSEPADRCSKTSSSDSACRSSKVSSCESADIAVSESVDDTPIVQIIAQAPQSKTAAVADSSDKNRKLNSVHPQNCETPRYSEFRASVGVSSSTPIQPGATPTILGPTLVIPENRKPNFGTTSATKQIEFIVSVGKRPALFRPC